MFDVVDTIKTEFYETVLISDPDVKVGNIGCRVTRRFYPDRVLVEVSKMEFVEGKIYNSWIEVN